MDSTKKNKILGISSALMMTAAFGMIMGGGAAGNRVVEVSGIVVMAINSLYWAVFLIRGLKDDPDE